MTVTYQNLLTGQPEFAAGLSNSLNTRSVVVDTTGKFHMDLDRQAMTITYNGPGGAADTFTAGPDSAGTVLKKTLTYTGGKVTGITGWVKQ